MRVAHNLGVQYASPDKHTRAPLSLEFMNYPLVENIPDEDYNNCCRRVVHDESARRLVMYVRTWQNASNYLSDRKSQSM